MRCGNPAIGSLQLPHEALVLFLHGTHGHEQSIPLGLNFLQPLAVRDALVLESVHVALGPALNEGRRLQG